MKKRIIGIVLSAVLLLIMCIVPVNAASGSISVNGEVFSGTLAEALKAAGAGGYIELSGTVYTMPIGKNDGSRVQNVTITGKDNAQLVLSEDFTDLGDTNLDVMTIKGNNVTLRDMLIDARWMVDYPLNVFGADNITIENVIVEHGKRGGVNVMTSGRVLFKDMTARDSLQAGFAFENCADASRIRFENCVTRNNVYNSGILICNGYASTRNVDASGLTCNEGHFSVHDRYSGTLGGGVRAAATFTFPPKNADGQPISTDRAMYYPLEKAYLHIRYGVSEEDTATAVCSVKTNCYGFDTTVYFDDEDTARLFLHEGEQIEKLGGSNPVFVFFTRILNYIKMFFSLLFAL